MNCTGCGHDVQPVTMFTAEGLVYRCPRAECNSLLGRPEPEPEPSAEEPVIHVPQRPAQTKPKQVPATFNVVKAARARLREVERQIKRLRKLEKERDELKRLLSAARAEPKTATVKSLRAS